MENEEVKITQDTGADFDRVIDSADLESLYILRRTAVTYFLKMNNLSAVVFEDSEEKREPSLRYLCGHPSDAILIIAANGDSVLIPWDEHLAAERAHAGKIVPFTKYERKNTVAVRETLKKLNAGSHPAVELPPSTPYPLFLEYLTELEGWDVKCRNNSTHDFVVKQRSVKDTYEIACTRKAAFITSQMTDAIEKNLRSGKIKTETDVALFIEKELRAFNCERTGFDTLAAGPDRSFAIHAFPGYTAGTWGSQGLSILDYGVVYNGYTSDATITIARGPLSKEQEEQIQTVQFVYDSLKPLYAKDLGVRAAAEKADALFAKHKVSMPHGLGHGIGLEIHEEPFVSKRTEESTVFKPGMIVTLEPGLYDPKKGGCRLENDILICESGNLQLTNSRIITL